MAQATSPKNAESAVSLLRSLLDDARELKSMKVEINGDYSPSDLATWDARLVAAEQVISELPLQTTVVGEGKTQLLLLQDAVAAQLRLWDATSALEKATAPEGEYSDVANDESIDHIKTLAAGLDAPEEAYLKVIDEHLTEALKIALL